MSVAPIDPPPADPRNRSNKQGYEQEAIIDNEPTLLTKFILTSTDLANIEIVGEKLFKHAVENKYNMSRGVSRLPTKVLKITTRKSPCGEGSKTFDFYEMRIHKRCLIMNLKKTAIRDLIMSCPEKDVNIEITCQDYVRPQTEA